MPGMPGALPDFLIAGAAKCGTTSLFHYLRAHPQIYLPGQKEPRYFTAGLAAELSDHDPRSTWIKRDTVSELPDYLALFRSARAGQVIGEGTATYLYFHDHAVPRIRELIPEASIVIILRDPVERAYSAWLQQRRDQVEDLSFEDALSREAERIAGRWGSMYHYAAQGFYSGQVEDFQRNFQRLKVILFDDLVADAQSVVGELCDFLKVERLALPEVGRKFNVSGLPRHPRLFRLLSRGNALTAAVRPAVDALLPAGFAERQLARLSASLLDRPVLRGDTRAMLRDRFRADVLRLEALLGRNLSAWMA